MPSGNRWFGLCEIAAAVQSSNALYSDAEDASCVVTQQVTVPVDFRTGVEVISDLPRDYALGIRPVITLASRFHRKKSARPVKSPARPR
jgi:hypothetical protein